MARKEAHSMYHTAKNMGYEYIQIFNDCTKSDISDWLKAGEWSLFRYEYIIKKIRVKTRVNC